MGQGQDKCLCVWLRGEETMDKLSTGLTSQGQRAVEGAAMPLGEGWVGRGGNAKAYVKSKEGISACYNWKCEEVERGGTLNTIKVTTLLEYYKMSLIVHEDEPPSLTKCKLEGRDIAETSPLPSNFRE